jgi:hypothetical protein
MSRYECTLNFTPSRHPMMRSAVESLWSEWKVSSSSVVDAVDVGDAQDLFDMVYVFVGSLKRRACKQEIRSYCSACQG